MPSTSDPRGARRSTTLSFRIADSDARLIRAAATLHDEFASDFLRRAAIQAAQRALQEGRASSA